MEKIVDNKNMDSVFAQATENDLDFETIFEGDIDDQLVDIVEGLTDEGEFVLDEAVEFDLMHQEDSDTPIKDMKKELGPDHDNDFGAKDVEGSDKVKLETEPEKTNGESDADKILDIDKLDQEHQDGKDNGKAPSGEEVTPEIEKEVKESADEESMNNTIGSTEGEGTGSVEVKDEAPAMDADLTPDCDCKGECDKDIDPATAPSDNGKDTDAVPGEEYTDSPKEEKVDNKDLSPDCDDKYNDSNTADIKESIEGCAPQECGDPKQQCCDNKPSNEELLAQLASNLGYDIVKKDNASAVAVPAADEGCCKEEEEMNDDLGDDSEVPTNAPSETCKEADKIEGSNDSINDIDKELDNSDDLSADGDDKYNDSNSAAVKESDEEDLGTEDEFDIIDAAAANPESEGIDAEDELADDIDDAIIADAEDELKDLEDNDDDIDLSYDPTDEDLIDAALGSDEV